jgi:trans-aconitate 2-methyltransferase
MRALGAERPVTKGEAQLKMDSWDPIQYARFRNERAQAFYDLLHRIPGERIHQAADLGCGTGELTHYLLQAWPHAHIYGVDESASMLSRSADLTADSRMHFIQADLRQWQPPQPLDCIISNAALHWVEDHAPLLARLSSLLTPGGILAVQIPNNADEYAYRVFREMLAQSPWGGLLQGMVRGYTVESPAWYHHTLDTLGFDADIWETTYYHQLPDAHAIVEWMKGTALRPVLKVLTRGDAGRFLSELTQRISAHYTATPAGVLFPFRRLFFIAALRISA